MTKKLTKLIQTPQLRKRLKKAHILASKGTRVLNDVEIIGGYIRSQVSDKKYFSHISKIPLHNDKARWTRYSVGCVYGEAVYGEAICSGNMTTKTICYHGLATLIVAAKEKDKAIIFSDKPDEFKKYLKTLPNVPIFIEVVNRQKPNNPSLWAIITKLDSSKALTQEVKKVNKNPVNSLLLNSTFEVKDIRKLTVPKYPKDMMEHP